jgi:hypothetical protein
MRLYRLGDKVPSPEYLNCGLIIEFTKEPRTLIKQVSISISYFLEKMSTYSTVR